MAKKTVHKSPKELDRLINEYISRQGNNTFNYRQAAFAIGAGTAKMQKAVAMILADKAFDGVLIETSPGKYRLPAKTNVVEGVFSRRSNGKNFVVVNDSTEAADGEATAYAVDDSKSMHALNGDLVKVIIAANRRGVEAEAEVVEIIEPKEQTFVGTLDVMRQFAYLKTDSRYLANDIFIPRNRLRGGTTGDKAVVRITSWPMSSKNPSGEVLDILGRSGENNCEIHAILAEYDLPYRYPESVEKAAEAINPGITPEEIARREDFRRVATFTIDPADAKDFDDALSFRRLDNGNVEVGVHIADVTHYVTPGSIIDQEAEERATSVYLVDRTVPMLPERLCNFICSLRPGEDKLTYSCIFELDNDANIVSHRILRTVICSDRRFSYEEAQAVLDSGTGDFSEELEELNRLAKILRDRRFKDGALDFDRAEVYFDLDDDGYPLRVNEKVLTDANHLIEEFMLLANKAVATRIGNPAGHKKAKPFVYRVHDKPDEAKLSELASIAATFGHKLKTEGSMREVNRSINQLLHDVKGTGEDNLISTLAIRSMAKAVYSTVNVGHYGLSFEYYTHFTSPIRRFPDMMVHRLLTRYLDGGRAVNRQKLEEKCKHSSEMEQTASLAERASIKYKQVEYMSDFIGHEYDAVITGVTEWGLYVEPIENKCEGLVSIRSLANDFYDFDEKSYSIVGQRNRNNRYRLGDIVRVKMARANIEKRLIDYELVDGSSGSKSDGRNRQEVRPFNNSKFRRGGQRRKSRRR